MKALSALILITGVLACAFVWQTRVQAAATITAVSCSAADVQTALNAATSDTTVVRIPAGICHWSGSEVVLNIPVGNLDLSLLGAGSLTTTGGGDATLIIDDLNNGNDALLAIYTNGTASAKVRVAGLTLQGGSGVTKNQGFLKVASASGISPITRQVRIDHNHFNSGTYTSGATSDTVKLYMAYGVMDHNIFDRNVHLWLPDSGGQGDLAWSQPTALGSADFFFLEDNVMSATWGMNDCSHGGRWVVRYNTVATDVQTHPTGGSGRGRGCRAWEVYKNTFRASGSPFNAAFISSGTGLIWGNTVGNNYGNFITLHAMRQNSSTYQEAATPNGWGYCGTAFNGTGSNWDQNAVTSMGSACLDQPGRGQGDLLAGDFPNVRNAATGCLSSAPCAWPRQRLEPIYEWLNTFWSTPYTVYEPGVLVANRDYYAATTNFTGASGVGTGLLANRPTSCTTGVAYWGTDTTTLYQCAATNTWAAYYTPYAYPHPLTTGQTPATLPNGTYTTSFPLTENPISEGGVWVNGGTTGLDWTNVRTTPGRAFGTQPGNSANPYNDATAVLLGTWSPDQSAQATVFVTTPPTGFAEVELRLRTTITPLSITGYEFNCSVVPGQSYLQIVRWNGPLGSFTQLDGRPGTCANGDVLAATAQGSTLTLFKNGVAVFSVNDSTFTTGAPGIGMFLQNATGINATYGFTNFTATNVGAPPPPPPATPCVSAPLKCTVIWWPSASMGDRRLRYNCAGPAGNQIQTVELKNLATFTPSAVFTDTRACSVTVTK